MNNLLTIMSHVFAAIYAICFVAGVTVLSSERGNDYGRRHITGDILLSMSMLFGGLAFTVMTIKNEENDDE